VGRRAWKRDAEEGDEPGSCLRRHFEMVGVDEGLIKKEENIF
jgi:hypothetical protein